jgi:hypothetical protein
VVLIVATRMNPGSSRNGQIDKAYYLPGVGLIFISTYSIYVGKPVGTTVRYDKSKVGCATLLNPRMHVIAVL